MKPLARPPREDNEA
jgi:chromosome segregation ATPase